MTAAAFIALANRRVRCSVNVRNGQEFGDSGQSKDFGLACVGCPGCESLNGDMGIAQAGFHIERSESQFKLKWLCPSCGQKVSEDTTPLGSFGDVKIIDLDPICFTCRKHKLNK